MATTAFVGSTTPRVDINPGLPLSRLLPPPQSRSSLAEAFSSPHPPSSLPSVTADSPPSLETLYTALIDPATNRNNASLYCPRAECRSLVLRAGTAELVERPEGWEKMFSPAERFSEHATLFWMVDNMLTFENVGFSTPVPPAQSAVDALRPSGLRLLACADCDHGPIGYHQEEAESGAGAGTEGGGSTGARKLYFVAAERLRYAASGSTKKL